MTTLVDIANRACGVIGTRTTITAAELAASGSNEAIQFNLIYAPYRNRLLRMAPWNCCFNTTTLTYITSAYGTPENVSGATNLWQKGQPTPPWAYEYQYPVDCLRACWITPQTATGFAGGIPITTAVTGGAPSFWQGPPVKFKIGVDQFLMLGNVTPVSAGVGYAIGDYITLPATPATSTITNKLGTFLAGCPQGAAAVLQVTGVNGSGGITSVVVVNQILSESPVLSGSYFYGYSAAPSQASTTGAGTGATFSLDIGLTGVQDQRVILTNQEFALLNYCKLVTDPNVFDDSFQEALVRILGLGLTNPLTGDKGLKNQILAETNEIIKQARGDDGNEGLTVNDVIPDWLRVRGVNFIEDYSGPYNTGFNWGGMWPGFN